MPAEHRHDPKPEWWTPLPSEADRRIHRANPVSDRRLVVYLEFGWAIRVRCLDCNKHSVVALKQMLGAWRKYLNAPLDEIRRRMVCECGGRLPQMYEVNGHFAERGMEYDATASRATWVRKALGSAGLDPADYGYPPTTR